MNSIEEMKGHLAFPGLYQANIHTIFMIHIYGFMVYRPPTHRRSSVHRGPIFAVNREIKGGRARETIIVTIVEPGSNNVACEVRCQFYKITALLFRPIREEPKCVHFFDRLFLRNLLVQASCDEPDVGEPHH